MGLGGVVRCAGRRLVGGGGGKEIKGKGYRVGWAEMEWEMSGGDVRGEEGRSGMGGGDRRGWDGREGHWG